MTVGEPFIPYRQFQGPLIPEGLLKFAGVCRGAVLLYGQLARYAGKNGLCFPGIERLADDLLASGRTIQRWVRELVDAGLLRRRRRGAGTRSNSYQFLWSDLLGRQLAFDFGDPLGLVQKLAGSVENLVENEGVVFGLSGQKCRVSEAPILMCEEIQDLCSRRADSEGSIEPVEIESLEGRIGSPETAAAPAAAEPEPNMAKRSATETGAERPESAGTAGTTKTAATNAVRRASGQEKGIPERRDAGRAAFFAPNRNEPGRPMQSIGALLAARLNKMADSVNETSENGTETAA